MAVFCERYPSLGIATLHGFAAEQQGTRGVQVATLVNPGTTVAPEIDAAAKILLDIFSTIGCRS